MLVEESALDAPSAGEGVATALADGYAIADGRTGTDSGDSDRGVATGSVPSCSLAGSPAGVPVHRGQDPDRAWYVAAIGAIPDYAIASLAVEESFEVEKKAKRPCLVAGDQQG